MTPSSPPPPLSTGNLTALPRWIAVVALAITVAGALALLHHPANVLGQQPPVESEHDVEFKQGYPQFINGPADGVYNTGETVEVKILLNMSVEDVEDDPMTMSLLVGDTRRAMQKDGVEGAWLGFTYEVTSTDVDKDGISIPADGISGKLQINDSDSAYNGLQIDASSLLSATFEGGDRHLVNFIHVKSMHVDTDIGDSDPFLTGHAIHVYVLFSHSVRQNLGHSRDRWPRLAIEIGDNTRQATLNAGGLTRDGQSHYSRFVYIVSRNDVAERNIRIPENPFSGETAYKGVSGNLLDMGEISHPGLTPSPALRVNPQPDITSISITSSPVNGEHYVAGETIKVLVRFRNAIQYGSSLPRHSVPTIRLRFDGTNRSATATNVSRSGGQLRHLELSYTVHEDDVARQGVAVIANSLRLNQFPYDVDEPQPNSLLHRLVPADSSHAVWTPTAVVTDVRISSQPTHDAGYLIGDNLEVEVAFDTPVALVDDAVLPYLTTVLVHPERQAGGSRSLTYVSGSGTDLWRFAYEIVSGDVAYTGLAVQAIGPDTGWPEGLVRQIPAGPVDVTSGAREVTTQQQVYGGIFPSEIEILSAPANLASYVTGEEFRFVVRFDELMTHEGDRPQLNLQVGENLRAATLIPDNPFLTQTYTFVYTFTDEDEDLDGIEIPDTLFVLNDDLDLSFALFPADREKWGTHPTWIWTLYNPDPGVLSGHAVNRPPDTWITDVRVASEQNDEMAYLYGDTIEIAVLFNEPVEMIADNDPPWLTATLAMGSDEWNRRFSYASGAGTDTWRFRYTVQRRDASYPNTSITAIGPDSGWPDQVVRRVGGGAVNATFEQVSFDLPVYGGIFATGVSIDSEPSAGSSRGKMWYVTGDTFRFTTTYEYLTGPEEVLSINLKVGDNIRVAQWSDDNPRTGASSWKFEYTFTDEDYDADGIEILDTSYVEHNFDNGYIHVTDEDVAADFGYLPIWEFRNPEPGVLDDHLVNLTSEDLLNTAYGVNQTISRGRMTRDGHRQSPRLSHGKASSYETALTP